MKTLVKILFIFFVLVLIACGGSKHAEFTSAKVKYVSNNDFETLRLSSIEVGSNKEEAIYNAQKLAFQNLFFRGIPNSPYKKPLISLNEAEAYKKHKKYLNDFYNGRMQTFITNSTDFINKKGAGVTATVNLIINMRALRKDLQNNNLMQKFGI
ncbi:hypothetical protein Q4Q39_02395 [Flavivirga amylovorans]|uniref:Lipoprotein n=1 Tax=Flavivirga amylovorans TaxID=870486 RepID=A0ABT8WXN5_9FLAO|nr:hypothetical protein [Flavivirga amylovorans]MDO5986243.1 hypothetical protein [Flavivirga amylovorans]